MYYISWMCQAGMTGGKVQVSGCPTWGVSLKSCSDHLHTGPVKDYNMMTCSHLKGGRGSQVGPDWAMNCRLRASLLVVTFMSVPP